MQNILGLEELREGKKNPVWVCDLDEEDRTPCWLNFKKSKDGYILCKNWTRDFMKIKGLVLSQPIVFHWSS